MKNYHTDFSPSDPVNEGSVNLIRSDKIEQTCQTFDFREYRKYIR